jgi:hypothetical protein
MRVFGLTPRAYHGWQMDMGKSGVKEAYIDVRECAQDPYRI